MTEALTWKEHNIKAMFKKKKKKKKQLIYELQIQIFWSFAS